MYTLTLWTWLILFPSSTIHLVFPLALHLSPQLILPFFLHHWNADHTRYKVLPLAASESAPNLNHRRSPTHFSATIISPESQILSAHTVTARQQVVVVGNQNKSPFTTATDTNPVIRYRYHKFQQDLSINKAKGALASNAGSSLVPRPSTHLWHVVKY